MKKILNSVLIITLALFVSNVANAVCLECPEIQKELKKELNLTKTQKKEIKKIKKDMRAQIKNYQKAYNKNTKKIDKILYADVPDIVLMVELKKENAKIKQDASVAKKEALAQIFEVYTEEQQFTAKRVLSENSGIITKGHCEFCENESSLKIKKKKND